MSIFGEKHKAQLPSQWLKNSGLILLVVFILLLVCTSCTAIRKTDNYPDKFIVTDEYNCGKYNYYFMENDYYIYHRKDFADENDTLIFKPFIFDKYLLIKKQKSCKKQGQKKDQPQQQLKRLIKKKRKLRNRNDEKIPNRNNIDYRLFVGR